MIVLAILFISLGNIEVDAQQKGSITVNYFDDNQQEQAVEGSRWLLIKVADIATAQLDEVDGLKITSCIQGLHFDHELTLSQILAKLDLKLIDESHQSFNNNLSLVSYEKISDQDGKIVFDDLAYGVYLGLEMEAANNHLLTKPFLISLPYTVGQDRSDIELVIEPKAILAGDLRIIKQLRGNAVDEDEQFVIKVNLPQGRYHYRYEDGQDGYVQDGDELLISSNNELVIEDVLANQSYKIEEKTANRNGYQTTYDNHEGEILAKNEQVVKIINSKYINDVVDTKVKSGIMLAIVLWLCSIAGILGMAMWGKKDEH